MKTLFALALFPFALAINYAQTIELRLNQELAVFHENDTIEVFADISGIESETIHVKVSKNNYHVILDTEIPLNSDTLTIFSDTFDEPCSIMVEVSSGETKDAIGAIVNPGALKPGSDRPNDFDSFWEHEKKALYAMPFEVNQDPIELEPENEGLLAFDVEINSPGPRPARAILVKPKNAAPKSLPIIINLHAAGVKGSWCRAHLNEALGYAKKGKGALSFDLNAHGMLNHEEESYYEELENGPLKSYWDFGVESRDDYYFGYMYKRMLRSIEYLTRQPEWDGKRILVIGESQGGGQALAAAGLDHRISAVVATVPAMCDFGGPLAERKGGWPQPIDWRPGNEAALSTVPYFDTAHILAGSNARMIVEIGLIDQTCPSTSIYAAINQAEGDVTVYPVSYRTHGWPKQSDRDQYWNEEVFAKKNAFIDDYLK